jgi:MFS family permease
MRFFSLQGLWHHKDFLKFWTGETISAFGSQVTAFALPLTAALTLQATAIQMGLLSFLAFAPMLFLSLFAGVVVDRLPRRPVLIIASLGQAMTIGAIPFAALLHLLRLEYLYALALVSGCLTVFFEVAYQAYLPSLVEQEQTLEGNGKLETSHALAQIAGPGFAGWVVQVITAPLAMLIDACSFLISALFLCWIRKPEPRKEPHETEQAIFKEIGEGLKTVLHHRILWSIAACNGTINLFNSAIMSIAVLYVVRDLKIEPIMYGFITATGSLGALLGSFLAKQMAGRFGIGPVIVGSALLYGVGGLLLPLASVSMMVAIPFLMLSWFVQSLTLIVFNITQVSLRQCLIPGRLQGRLNASMRFLICSALPLGSLLGGACGEAIGLLPTIMFSTGGMLFAFLWVLFSPVASLREQPSLKSSEEPGVSQSTYIALVKGGERYL